ncbi:MAG TPA: tail fiber domain-containing protein, partial [Ignavibacteria bacterium]
NSSGYDNSAFGSNSLYNNTTGYYNTGFGSHSLYTNNTGYYNSAFGSRSLFYNTGLSNSAFGNNALENNTTGAQNSALGVYAGFQISTGSNNTAIGYNAQVPSGTASNQVRIGNTSITYAGIQVAWTVTSDLRLKSNVTNSNLGLDFISGLKPVSYTRINDDKQKTEYGFIAQEVEETLKQSGIENTGMISVDDEGIYSLRYNDLIAPMVKAIQELKEENQNLKNEIEELKKVQDKVNVLEKIITDLTSTKEVNLSGK